MKSLSAFPLIIIIFVLNSCNNRESNLSRTVTSFIGKEIVFPSNLICQIQQDSIIMDFDEYDYTIVSYIDSKGCTSCQLNLNKWNNLINNLNSYDNNDINFIMIIHASDGDYTKVSEILKRECFLYPIYFDYSNDFASLNKLPENKSCHTFLLDKSKNVTVIGNPLKNPGILKLYRDLILENNEPYFDRCAIHLGVVISRDSICKQFEIQNTSKNLITIQEILPSCDCVEATVSTDSILKGQSAILDIKLSIDSVEGPIKKYVDIYFNENENPKRYTLYGYVKQLK